VKFRFIHSSQSGSASVRDQRVRRIGLVDDEREQRKLLGRRAVVGRVLALVEDPAAGLEPRVAERPFLDRLHASILDSAGDV
jgi:hypothetical protein